MNNRGTSASRTVDRENKIQTVRKPISYGLLSANPSQQFVLRYGPNDTTAVQEFAKIVAQYLKEGNVESRSSAFEVSCDILFPHLLGHLPIKFSWFTCHRLFSAVCRSPLATPDAVRFIAADR